MSLDRRFQILLDDERYQRLVQAARAGDLGRCRD